MTPREQAIADCTYAKSLGETALKQHYLIWRGATIPLDCQDDIEYASVVVEFYEQEKE